MVPSVVIGFVILALLAWPVGVALSRIYWRWRYRIPTTSRIPGRTPPRLMSPLEWASIGAALLLLGARTFVPGLQPPSHPPPAPAETTAPAPTATQSPTADPQPANAPLAVTAEKQPAPAANSPTPSSPGAAAPLPTPAASNATPGPSGAAASPEAVAEEKRWCDQGDRMMALAQHSMAAQAYWEALRVQPQSERGRAGLSRARRAVAEEKARERQAAAAAAAMEYGSGWASEAPSAAPTASAPPRASAPAGGGGWGHREDAGFHRSQADRLLAKGMAHAAIGEYQKAIDSDPSDVKAREGLDRARRAAAATAQPTPEE